MEYIKLGNMKISNIALGCMRLNKSYMNTEEIVLKAVELGINFFDHADIYGNGQSEKLFGEVLRKHPYLRKQIYLQSKCSIKANAYDFSYQHIITQVNQSLVNLNTNYLDVLLLHRPDIIFDLNELKHAINDLYHEGKINYFGVSNMSPQMITYLQENLDIPIIINQIQFNVVHSLLIDNEIYYNMKKNTNDDTTNGLFFYARSNNILLQPWSVLMASWEEGTYINNPDYQPLNDYLNILADKYHVTSNAVALNWILKLNPIQPIIGTTSIKHLTELVKANDFNITKDEWYMLYQKAGKILP